MRIGIIVYSKTGHTLLVAKKLQEKLETTGHTASLCQLTTKDDTNLDSTSIPDISDFDMIYFGSCVQGFGLAPIMKQYFERINSLKDIPINLFVTQFFPFAFLGGNASIKKMEEQCKVKGGKVQKTGIVHWGKGKRDKQIFDLVENLSLI